MRWSRLAVVVVAFGAACNALTGVSDLDTSIASDAGAPCTTCGAPNPPPPPGQPPPPPSGADGSVDSGTKPSYCTGISFYARYDSTTTSAQGLTPTDSNGAAVTMTFAPGKFGNAASFVGTPQALYYDSDAGPCVPALGSVAMWLKPTWTWPTSVQRVFFKPVPTRVVGAGEASGAELENRATPLLFGLWNTSPDGSGVYAAEDPNLLAGSWKDLDWNHLAGTWDLAGSRLAFTLNGGSARFVTQQTWAPQLPILWFRIGTASTGNSIDALVDDVAIWTRVLSDAEITAIHTSPIAIGDACGL
ncbi:MAG TPA: LamG-like jellyroll fold domain-containing protein [Labilithrix sp.]